MAVRPKRLRMVVPCLLLALLPASTALARRNVILFVGDGMGFNHVAAARLYAGAPGVYERFPQRLAMSTFSAGGGYDPDRAWQSIDYLKSGATDSAAAATAMACGIKTTTGAIGVDAGGKPARNVVEAASAAGLATGVVTSVQWSHATPAGMVAHAGSRGSYAEIALQMLDSEVDLILGCGHPLYDNDGQPAEKPDYQYVGGEAVWAELARDAHRDWEFFDEPAEFAALAAGRLRLGPGRARVCGTARARGTLQEGRAGADKTDLPHADPPNASVPDLRTMTIGALDFLSRDPDGFFVMVEGGAIDWAAHDNLIGRVVEEVEDFNAAIAAAVAWVDARDAWDETLIVVTADHETGGLAAEPTGNLADARGRGAATLTSFQFSSTGHTNALVPFFARGVEAGRFAAAADQRDPRRGAYLDNTELGALLHAIVAGGGREARLGRRRMGGHGRR